MNPKVSVLIPAYNHQKYLKETIESVLNQTFEDFELLINDDCSTDNSAKIIRGYTDKRITSIFSEKNCGIVASLNKLVKMARGEYIAVLGSDDVWFPEKLEKQLEVLEKNPEIAASFTNVLMIDENSQPITKSEIFPLEIFEYKNKDKSEILFDFFISGNHFCHSSALIRTSVHREIGLYNPFYRQLHDLDLWIRILLKYNVFFDESKLVKYRYVQNADNVSSSTQSNNIRLYNEAKSIILYLFNNISDNDFVNGFKELLKNKETVDPIGIICEKFLILQEKSLWSTSCKTLPIDFIVDKLSDEVVERLEKDYDVTIRDIYNFSGAFCSNYDSQLYSTHQLTQQHASNLQLLLDESNQIINDLSSGKFRLLRLINKKVSFMLRKIFNKIATVFSKLLSRRQKK